MSFTTLIVINVWTKKARSIGLALAIAIAVMTVVTLTIVSQGLEKSAAAVLTVGKANFTVAQKGVSDILYSSIDNGQLDRIRETRGVKSAVGVLIETEHINSSNPLFLEIGIPPKDLVPFGVTVVAGHPYAPDATHEMMVGWRAAQNLGLHVGSKFHADGTTNTVVGIYSTGVSFGDLGAMFPLPAEQAYNRVPGSVSLVFVKTLPGISPTSVASLISAQNPELTTIETAQQFGRADRNLVFLQAAATGSTVLAVVIGAIIVGNAMLLSLFERTREFGLLRAIGWSRKRILAMVMGEGLVLAVAGAVIGAFLSFVVASGLESLPALSGILHVTYTASAFSHGFYTGVAMTILGTLYPSLRAAFLTPLKALSHE